MIYCTNLNIPSDGMKKYIGIIIFISLFIAAISIISILVARGYNFTGSEIKENGILNIISTPEGAKIYINGEQKATTPKKIELAAGQYEIKIAKENYGEWQKEVLVEASIVSDISATLFPTELSLEQLTFTNLDKAFFSDDGNIAIYVVSQEPNQGVWLTKLEKTIFEISSSQPTKVVEIEAVPEQCIIEETYNIKVAFDNSKALMECNLGNYKEFFLIDLRNLGSLPIKLNEAIGFNPDSVDFSFDANNVFIIDNEIIVSYNTPASELNLVGRRKENYQPHLTPFGNEFLLLEYSYNFQTRHLFRLASNLGKTEVDLGEALEIKDILSISGSAENPNMFVFTTSLYSAVYNFKQANSSPILEFIDSEVSSIQWAPEGLSFLFVKDNVLKCADIKEYPDGIAKIKTYTLLEDYNPSQSKVIWATNSQQVLIYDLPQEKIYAQDKDGTNQTILFEGQPTYKDAFRLSANETFLVILLEDDEGYSNLYSVKLKI